MGCSVHVLGVASTARHVTAAHRPCAHAVVSSSPQGKVANLEAACAQLGIDAKLGIAHTRWATHGAPNDVNAHPHTSMDGSVAVVHNGIIENFASLRQALISEGYKFVSDTLTQHTQRGNVR
jgi:glucosamine--fructose-6-phosphate aminotransferase (isomerizing)